MSIDLVPQAPRRVPAVLPTHQGIFRGEPSCNRRPQQPLLSHPRHQQARTPRRFLHQQEQVRGQGTGTEDATGATAGRELTDGQSE